jgi:hypothetical protein
VYIIGLRWLFSDRAAACTVGHIFRMGARITKMVNSIPRLISTIMNVRMSSAINLSCLIKSEM